MNILIVSFFNAGVTHLATELELAEKHLRQGDSVTFLACDGSVGGCTVNPTGDKEKCLECKLRRLRGIRELSGEVKIHHLRSPQCQPHELASALLPASPTIDDYKAVRYKRHDLGWAALSSAIYIHRDPLCDTKATMKSALVFLCAAVRSYEGTRRFLGKHSDYDCAYVYNGRFATTRGALRALQDAQIPFITHERGSLIHKYETYPDTLPHDRTLCQERTIEAWEEPNHKAEREKFAHQFYREKREGQAVAWKNYIKDQLPNTLPRDWDEDVHNVVIFNHSEDEFAAIGDAFTNSLYPSQAEAVRRIASDTLAAEKQIHYYLRVHPNLSGVENSSLNNLLAINSPNLTIIGPDEKISTYALLDACDCVLTFGSTMGAEATYWGKPSILAGECFYDSLDAAYNATSHEEVMKLLLQSDLPPKPNLGALKYGYFHRTRGAPFEYWEPVDLSSGHFKTLHLANDLLLAKKGHRLHNQLFVLMANFCRTSRCLKIADRIAGIVCMVIYRARNLGKRIARPFAK